VKGEPNSVVFVDLENIYIGFHNQFGRDLTARELVEKARSFGGVKTIQVYGDFSESTYPERFKVELDNAGVQAINVPKERDREGKPTKNKIDVRIVVDIFKCLAFRSEVARYILLSGDKIFLDVLNLIRNEFRKEMIVCGIEGTVAQVLKEISSFVPFEADTAHDDQLEKFVRLMNRLEHEILEGKHNYVGWKLIINEILETGDFEYDNWGQARDFFERIKSEGRLVQTYYPSVSREIEAYRLDRKNPSVRKILGLQAESKNGKDTDA
jgi:uncharacterized LabA/DUF88 family protein